MSLWASIERPETLRRCPFCGADAQAPVQTEGRWHVWCSNSECAAHGPEGSAALEARFRWNIRLMTQEERPI